MQRIKLLFATLHRARKRTGAILAPNNFEEVIGYGSQAGFNVVDISDHHSGKLLLTDDQLIEKVRLLAGSSPCLFLNLEMYIGPRLNNPNFFTQLLQKLIILEPKQPIVFLLYSARIFSSFNAVYGLTFPENQHTLNLVENPYFE